MRRIVPCSVLLLLISANVAAQTPPPDSQITQALITEIRQLRNDLQTAAATIQRVQIAMYRIQSQAAVLDRATQRLEQARGSCSQAEAQQKGVAAQIEQAEAQKRDSQNPAGQRGAEGWLANLKTQMAMLATQEQQCQAEQAEAETQFRAEKARMDDQQERLDKLDRVLAGYASK